MIPELGHFALILALCVAVLQFVVPMTGAATRRLAWMAVARPAAQIQFVLVAICSADLVVC
jgi:cytochrome c-type biogenesis protein CcmF